MTLERFLRSGEPSWGELEELLEQARGRPDRLSPPSLLRLGALYRGAAADLATARRRYPHDPVRQRLERLVAAAAITVYDAHIDRSSLLEFIRRGYWRRIAERPLALLIAWALLIGPAA